MRPTVLCLLMSVLACGDDGSPSTDAGTSDVMGTDARDESDARLEDAVSSDTGSDDAASGVDADVADAESNDAAPSDAGGIVDATSDSPDTGPCTPGAWTTETVVAGSDTGHQADIVVDGDGALHFSYHDEGAEEVRAATNATGDWVETTLTTGRISSGTSLEMDAAGGLHVAYGAELSMGLAYLDGGSWVRQDVGRGFAPALAVRMAPTGTLRGVAFFRGASVNAGDLAVAFGSVGNPLTTETADDNGEIATSGIDIVFDDLGVAHVLYQVQSTGEARYARTVATGSGWEIETLPSTGGGGLGAAGALVLGDDGRVHACYSLRSEFQLRVATRSTDGVWTEVEVGGTTSTECDLAFDGHGDLHVVFRAPNIVHAVSDGAGGFTLEDIAESRVQRGLGLYITADNALHVGWGSRSLRYSHRSGCPSP